MTEPGHRPYVEQLRDTLAFAVENIPWYRDRAERYGRPMDSYDDLALLPIIDRDDVSADQLAFTASDDWPTSTSYSSATTGGIGQTRWRGAAEDEALRSLLRSSQVSDADSTDALTLVVHPYDQGAPGPVANRDGYAHVAMYVPWHYDLIHDVLRHGWPTPGGRRRISAIQCFSPGLRILTEWFDQRGIDPRAFGVSQLFGYGSIQSAPWRRRLAASWDAHYQDIYGLSEVMLAAARECPLCGAYHYSTPIIPEVVHPETRKPIERGTGVLLLTELHPYAQLQLLIRYWTDDLVELAPQCPLGGFGIKFRGRLGSSVIISPADRDLVIVGSNQVGEICADSADVALAAIDWAPWARDVGAPVVDLSAEGAEVTVSVQLRYLPELFRDRADGVVEEIGQALRQRITGLADAIDTGAVTLRVDALDHGVADHR